MLERLSSIKGFFLLMSVPLFLSQIWLLPYFPEETHALVDDWAYITHSFIFFLYGYILLSDKTVIQNMIKQRRIYASFSIALSALYFFDWFHSIDPYVNETFQVFLLCLAEMAIALTLISYAGRYINHDHPIRRHLNDAIYPFYILHQTAILVVAFSLAKYSLSVGVRALLLTMISFTVCLTIYLLIIRPFKVTRLLFGMHNKKTTVKQLEVKSRFIANEVSHLQGVYNNNKG
jgi:hypothetical protein